MPPAPRTSEPEFVAASTFALRTPLLPWDELERWGRDLRGADPATVATLRQRLMALIARPEVDEAIHVASPGLHGTLDAWRQKPESERGQRIEGALVRYLVRMATRSTPFGLFSGVGTGTFDRTSRLAVPPVGEQIRRSRLDNDVLFALADALARDPERRRFLHFFPNTSLYRSAGRLRYAEARMGASGRNYHLVSVEPSPYLDATLQRAARGARLADLAAALVADDPEIELADAEAFVGELADTQILVPDLGVAVTGPEPIDAFLAQLERAELGEVAARVARIRAALAAIDGAGPGTQTAKYDEVTAALEGLPVKADPSRLVQVDLVRPPCGATLGPAVVRELQRATDALRKLSGRGEDPLTEFKRAFNERYEGREMPLAEALDEESGVGFEAATGPGSEGSPLLAGLRFPGAAGAMRVGWSNREQHLAGRLAAAWASGDEEIVLTDADLTAMAGRDALPMADAWAAMVRISAASGEAIDRGDFTVLFEGGGGPSGARMLGRFCHASPEIDDMVREHLRAEEALRPEAIYAEVVHLTEGRIGNILCRPVLREHEIEYLGMSGAPADKRISIDDLTVSVVDDRVVLRSRSLGREVVPRLTSAHNTRLRSLGLYRFLSTLQHQGTGGVGWNWGFHDSAPFLPRVRIGKAVVSRARWKLSKDDLAGITKAVKDAGKGGGLAAIFDAVQALRAKRKLPVISVVADGDNELALDLDNALCAGIFADTLAGRSEATVVEAFPAPDRLCAEGPTGRFSHELVVCYVRKPDTAAPPAAADAAPAPVAEAPAVIAPPAVPRRLIPGSNCLYLKIYTGTATADRLLREVIHPLAAERLAAGDASHWFFIRYHDPQSHLRVRFFGEPARLLTGVLPAFERALAPLVDDGSVWRFQLDTYDREIERYGGSAGIELLEQQFWADSEAVTEILSHLPGDAGADLRWLVGLRGADQLLADIGLDDAARAEVFARARDSFDREHRTGTDFHKQLGERYRARKADIDRVMTMAGSTDPEGDPLALAVGAIDRRSLRFAATATELRARDEAGLLRPRLRSIGWSLVHMHLNRLLHASQRAQELVLYDFLRRYHASRKAQKQS